MLLLGSAVIMLGHMLLAVLLFTNGFLIRRLSLNDTSSVTHPELKRFDKAVILFVDALRFDFIFSSSSSSSNSLYGLPTIETLIRNERHNAKLYKFIADPPTTTMQRIKALMSGTLPTFIDAGANFDSYIIDDDSLIKQAHAHNKSVVVLGDDTWLSLFEAHTIAFERTYPSFNIKDLDTNDINVDRELMAILKPTKADNATSWHLIVAHYLGLDHCGHSMGARSPVIKRKLKDIDDTISRVVRALDNDTLLVVMGDHGMTETGDHGGDSRPELETALFVYAKHGGRAGWLARRGGDDLERQLDDMLFAELAQINLTPTLALALGLPIPFSSLGTAVYDLFAYEQWSTVAHANVAQVARFVSAYEQATGERFDNIAPNEAIPSRTDMERYLASVQEHCRQKWSTFDVKQCLLGLLAVFLSIVSTFLFLSCFTLSSEQLAQKCLEQIQLAAVCLALSVVVAVSFRLSLVSSSLVYLIGFNALFLIVHCYSVVSNRRRRLTLRFNQSWFELAVFALVCLVPFSNSFVINEALGLRFLIVTVLLVDTAKSALRWRQECSRLFALCFVVVLVRVIASAYHVCREEHGPECTQTLLTTTRLGKLPSTHYSFASYASFIACNVVCIAAVCAFLARAHKCTTTAATRAVHALQVVMLGVYMTLDLVMSEDPALVKHVGSLWIARVFYVLVLVGGWTLANRSGRAGRAIGVLVSVGMLVSLVSDESMLAVWLLILALHLYYYIHDNSSTHNRLVFLLLVKYYFFYATAHETTFTHIKWHAAFHGIDGDSSNNAIVRLAMMLLVVVNTFSSTLITHLATDLILVGSGQHTFSSKVALTLKINAASCIKLLFSAVSVFVLRRHLMIWKIFAPRFVFEALGFVVGVMTSVFSMAFIRQN